MTQQQRRILIFEPNADGHRLSYVRDLATYALAQGDSVSLVVPTGSAEAAVHLSTVMTRCELRNADKVKSLETLTDELCADVTVVPSGDVFATRLGIRRAMGVHWRGRGEVRILMMRWSTTPQAQTFSSRARNAVKRWAVRHLRSAADVTVFALASAAGPSEEFELPVAPDPVRVEPDVDMIAALRDSWAVGSSRIPIGMIGAIDERKNLALVLDALLAAGRKDMVLVLAGRVDPDVWAGASSRIVELRELGVEVIVEDRLLGDVELDSYVAAVDFVVLAHSNEGPSGILGKAMTVGTGVLASGAVSLREDVLKLNRSCDQWVPLDADSLAASFNRLVAHEHLEKRHPVNGGSFARVLLVSAL